MQEIEDETCQKNNFLVEAIHNSKSHFMNGPEKYALESAIIRSYFSWIGFHFTFYGFTACAQHGRDDWVKSSVIRTQHLCMS